MFLIDMLLITKACMCFVFPGILGYKMVTLACQNEMQVEADPSMCKGSSIPGVVPKKCSAEPCKKCECTILKIIGILDNLELQRHNSIDIRSR